MNTVIDVFLITGFLGSGKTTFLNHFIDAFPPERKLTILMNEFGEIGIDGILVEGDDLDILEINRGSIFCACVKTDFIKGLVRILEDIQPDILVIEATGTADPGDMKRDLRLPIFRNRFHFRDQICIIDAASFPAVYETFASVEKQMTAATCFVVNKIDLAETLEIERIREIIHRHHPDPTVFETVFGRIPVGRFTTCRNEADAKTSFAKTIRREADVEAAIAALLKDPFRVTLPPDALSSTVWTLKEATTEAFHALVRQLPSRLLRAKGFVRLNGEIRLFNWVMGRPEIIAADTREIPDHILGRLVFIGSADVLRELSTLGRHHPLVLEPA